MLKQILPAAIESKQVSLIVVAWQMGCASHTRLQKQQR